MTPSEGLKNIIIDINKIVDDEVLNLYKKLVKTSPVGETGAFRRSWNISEGYITTNASKDWTISNFQEYATILAGGRRFVNGKMQGSIQWSAGITPMLQKTFNNINRRTNNVKY